MAGLGPGICEKRTRSRADLVDAGPKAGVNGSMNTIGWLRVSATLRIAKEREAWISHTD